MLREIIFVFVSTTANAKVDNTVAVTSVVISKGIVLLIPSLKYFVVNFLVLIDDIVSIHLGYPWLWRKFQDSSNQQICGTHSDASSPLSLGHRDSSSNAWEVLTHDNLESKCANDNQEEVIIMQEFLKHIEVLSSDLSAIDLIEQLQEEEYIENVSEVLLLALR